MVLCVEELLNKYEDSHSNNQKQNKVRQGSEVLTSGLIQ